MLQVMLRGKVLSVDVRKVRQGSKPIMTIEIGIRVWRNGAAVQAAYLCVFDEYWTERWGKLEEKPKYMSVRGSDITPAHEPTKDNEGAVICWIKAEEFWL